MEVAGGSLTGVPAASEQVPRRARRSPDEGGVAVSGPGADGFWTDCEVALLRRKHEEAKDTEQEGRKNGPTRRSPPARLTPVPQRGTSEDRNSKPSLSVQTDRPLIRDLVSVLKHRGPHPSYRPVFPVLRAGDPPDLEGGGTPFNETTRNRRASLSAFGNRGRYVLLKIERISRCRLTNLTGCTSS